MLTTQPWTLPLLDSPTTIILTTTPNDHTNTRLYIFINVNLTVTTVITVSPRWTINIGTSTATCLHKITSPRGRIRCSSNSHNTTTITSISNCIVPRSYLTPLIIAITREPCRP